MGRYFFRLPDVGEGVAEAEIVAQHVKAGDRIAEDQALVDVMTDKATVDMASPVAGVVTAVHGEIGAKVAVGSVLIEMEVDGPNDEEAVTMAANPPAAQAPVDMVSTEARPVDAAPGPQKAKASSAPPAFSTRAWGDEPLAAPATRQRAYQLGIPLQFVPGTGPGGRITPDDLETYIGSGGREAARSGGSRYQPKDAVQEVRIIGLRRTIAEKMEVSKRRIPHFGYVEEFDLTELESLRNDLNVNRSETQPKLTLLPFLMRAIVRALPDFPQINARYDDDAGVLQTFAGVHIGIATQTPGGLLVPVVHHAETLNLWECAAELGRVTAAARNGKATREELTGSTITLTSLGPLGGIAATPVINHPEVAIIGPNKLVERPVVINGQIAIRKMMNLSSAFDHRIVDGHDAALFIQRIKRLIEHPALIFMD